MKHALMSGAICAAFAVSAQAVSLNQVDDFQDGTVMGWGGGSFPTNIATGGPAGAGDRYLLLTASGSPLGMRNDGQWTGDYLSAGVTGVSAHVRNEGAVPLELRALLLFGAGGDFTSTVPVVVPADSSWYQILLPITAADLTHVGFGGTGNANDTLSGVGRLLIRHQAGSPTGAGSTTPFTGQVGFDNIRAVPEPAALSLLALGLIASGRRRPSARR